MVSQAWFAPQHPLKFGEFQTRFLLLGSALDGAAKLDTALAWTASPLVKAAESGLVFLLAVHLLGGLRVLMIENFAWREGHKSIATVAIAVALMLACIFFLRAA